MLVAAAPGVLRGGSPGAMRSLEGATWLMLTGGVLIPGTLLYGLSLLGPPTLLVERYWCALLIPSALLVGVCLDLDLRPRRLAPALAAMVVLLGPGRETTFKFDSKS